MSSLFHVNDGFTYMDEPHIDKNTFLHQKMEQEKLPIFEDIIQELPVPLWDGHDDAIDCYWKTWEIAFHNLKQPVEGSGFVSNYIDTAFNGNLFMWDSTFITMFGKYGCRAFNFQKTLDNFYSHQHLDGFICREICENVAGEVYYRHDPASTGPNIMPWSEWEYYETTGDIDRLSKVFDPLMAYYIWMRENRTWPDGSYWSTGWACGMDNMPRVMPGYSSHFSHAHQVWIDACIQQVLSAKCLIKMARELNREGETAELKTELELLSKLINEELWDDTDAFFYDKWKTGKLNHVKSIGAYWALLADIVPNVRLARFVEHLDNPIEFKRPHRIPTLSADHLNYSEDGEYWNGGVWAPTNYMVLKGLEKKGYHQLSYEIACNHLNNVVKVYKQTGTVWENYAPEKVAHGEPAKADFVGWTGLVPICVLFEFVFGIKPDSKSNKITWNIKRLERHGIMKYPFKNRTIDFLCGARADGEKPDVTIRSDIPVTVELIWNNQTEILEIRP